MKVAYLAGSIFPSTRASAVHMMKMCAALARAKHDVVLFGRRSPGFTDEDIFRYYGLDPTFELDLVSSSLGHRARTVAGGSRLLARANKFKPDLYLARRRPLAVVASFGSSPLIFDAHEMPMRTIDRRMESWIFGSASFRTLVTNTKALADEYLTVWPDLGPKVIVAHNASDSPSDTVTPRAIAKRPGVPQIGYVGSLYPGKGMETIVQLARREAGMDFHVVGGEKDHIRYWQEQGTASNITFHGHIRHADLSAYLFALDVALLPLQKRVSIDFHGSDIGKWTSPLKVFEYMAHGLPIIASDIPSLREVLVDGENSILVPPEDIDGWAQALTKIISNSAFANDLATHARMSFHNNFTWDARVAHVLNNSIGAV